MGHSIKARMHLCYKHEIRQVPAHFPGRFKYNYDCLSSEVRQAGYKVEVALRHEKEREREREREREGKQERQRETKRERERGSDYIADQGCPADQIKLRFSPKTSKGTVTRPRAASTEEHLRTHVL